MQKYDIPKKKIPHKTQNFFHVVLVDVNSVLPNSIIQQTSYSEVMVFASTLAATAGQGEYKTQGKVGAPFVFFSG